MRRAVLCLLMALGACGHEDRGWRGNMAGDYRLVAACAADRLSVRETLWEAQRLAVLADGARIAAPGYEARLQETAPHRFFAEVTPGSEAAAGRVAWQVIEECAGGGPGRILPPARLRAAYRDVHSAPIAANSSSRKSSSPTREAAAS